MITDAEIMSAFQSIAPAVMADPPETVLSKKGIEPLGVTNIGRTLTHMFAAQQTPPEEAVPAAFIIGILVGRELPPLGQ